MFKFFRTSLLALLISVAFFQGCLTYNHEVYFNKITSVIALPNPVSLENCTTTIYCIIKSLKEPDIYWTSSVLGIIDDTNMTSLNRGVGSTYIGILTVHQCYRNAYYTCVSDYANRTEIGNVKVRLNIGKWECLDDDDCKVYPGSECEKYLCICKNRTSCVGKNTPPVINDLRPSDNDLTMKLNICHKLFICEAQGYNTSLSWGIIGYGRLKSLGKWHDTDSKRMENGIVMGKLLILECLKLATFFCEATNQQGTVTRNITVRLQFEKYQCCDNTDCIKYNGICSLHTCICKNGEDISLRNCSATKLHEEVQESSLSKSETNAIIVSTIIGSILITNLIIFIIYRISRRRTKSQSTDLLNSNRF